MVNGYWYAIWVQNLYFITKGGKLKIHERFSISNMGYSKAVPISVPYVVLWDECKRAWLWQYQWETTQRWQLLIIHAHISTVARRPAGKNHHLSRSVIEIYVLPRFPLLPWGHIAVSKKAYIETLQFPLIWLRHKMSVKGLGWKRFRQDKVVATKILTRFL